MTLLLTGANGRTGRAILKAMGRANIPTRAFIRSKEQEADLCELGAESCAIGDLGDAGSFARAMDGVDKVLHVGPPMHPNETEITAALVDAAKQAGVGHFIYYSVLHPLRREVRHHSLKLDAEEQLIESGLAYTILQPSRYMQHLEPIWPRVVSEGVHAMPFSTEKKFNVVDLVDLADACAVVASSDRHHYATYELAGPEALSQVEMAAIISEVIGKPVRAEAVPFDELEKKARAAGASDDRISQMLIMNRHYDTHGFRSNSNVLEYLLGRPANQFRSYIRRIASDLGGS